MKRKPSSAPEPRKAAARAARDLTGGRRCGDRRRLAHERSRAMAVRLLEQLVEKRVDALWKAARVLVDHQDDLPPAVPARDRLHLIAGQLAAVAPTAARERQAADPEAVSVTGDDDLAGAFGNVRLHRLHLSRPEQTPGEKRTVEVGNVSGSGDDRA